MNSEVINRNSGGEKVLIVYYSYSGNTRKIAKEIQKVVGGDIVEIQLEKSYPSGYNAILEQARQELHSGYKPQLKTRIENISSYDTVFVGSPNWWNTITPPVISFLSVCDMSGKKIIPFITHGGGGIGRSSADIAKICPKATVFNSLVVRGADVRETQKWLSGNWPL